MPAFTTELHRVQRPSDGIHTPVAFEYADETARLSAGPFVASDVLKVAHQQDNDTYWVLQDVTPTWTFLGGGTTVPSPKLYDAVVPDDFSLPSDAFASSPLIKSVFVKDGLYTETANIVVPSGGMIIGETEGGTFIDLSGGFQVLLDGSGGVTETAGTVAATNGSSAVVGTATTFTNISAGWWISLGDVFYEVLSIADDTNLTIVQTFQGSTFTGEDFIAQAMLLGTHVERLTLTGATGVALFMRAVCSGTVRDLLVDQSTGNGIELIDCGGCDFTDIQTQHSAAAGLVITNGFGSQLKTIKAYNNAADGFLINGTAHAITVSACQGMTNGGDGLSVEGTAEEVAIGAASIWSHNAGKGVNTEPTTANVTLSNCAITENGGDGCDFDGAQFTISNCAITENGGHGVQAGDRGVINGNAIQGNLAYGVNLIGDDLTEVVNNYIGFNELSGVNVTAGVDDATVGSNTFEANGQAATPGAADGITIALGALRTRIGHNVFVLTDAAGVDIDNNDPTTVFASTDPARTFFVSADATKTRLTTLAEAFAEPVSPAADIDNPVLVLVQGYIDVPPDTVPAGYNIQGHGGFLTSGLQTTDDDADWLELEPGSALRNLTLYGPDNAAFPTTRAVRMVTSAFVPAFVSECVLATFQVGMAAEGAGPFKSIIHCFRTGNRSIGGSAQHQVYARASSFGNFTGLEVAFMSGGGGKIADAIFVVDGANATMNLDASHCRNGNSDGIRIDNGGEARLTNVIFTNGGTATAIQLDNASTLRATSTDVKDVYDVDLLVSDTASTVFFQGFLNRLKIDNTIGNANLSLDFVDTATGEKFSTKSSSVGLPGFPADLHAGEGAPTSVELVIYQYDDSAGSGSRFTESTSFPLTFPGTTQTTDALLFGVPRQFWGLAMDLGIAMDTTGVVVWEYWDGGAWVDTGPTDFRGTGVLVHSPAPALLSRANLSWETLEEQSITFNQDIDSLWTADDAVLDEVPSTGSDLFWIRARMDTLPVTQPSFDDVMAIYSEVTLGIAGTLNHGTARRLGSQTPGRWEDAANGAATQDIGYSANIQVGHVNNAFNNGVIDRAAFTLPAKGEWDTSSEMELSMRIHSDNAAPSGNFEIRMWYGIDRDADIVSHGTTGPLNDTAATPVVINSGVAAQFQGTTITFPIHVPNLNPDLGHELLVQIERDATGGNPTDTANGNMIIRGKPKVRARQWRSGESQ